MGDPIGIQRAIYRIATAQFKQHFRGLVTARARHRIDYAWLNEAASRTLFRSLPAAIARRVVPGVAMKPFSQAKWTRNLAVCEHCARGLRHRRAFHAEAQLFPEGHSEAASIPVPNNCLRAMRYGMTRSKRRTLL